MFRILISLCIIQATLGMPESWPEGRVVGGNDADIRLFPYQVSLQYDESHICGGSIINPTHINTAAHCVYGSSPQHLRIVAGSSTLSPLGTHSQVRAVEEIYIHEEYNPHKMDYDVAMLKLAKPLKLTDYVNTIDRATNSPRPGSIVTVSGWGATSDFTQPPNHLQAVDLEVLRQDECQETYGSHLTERMLCATDRGKGAYYGDSGGPLSLNGLLVGFVSWGSGSSQLLGPGVYGRVTAYSDFYNRFDNE